MDNLVLTTVAVALSRGLSGAALVEIFAETDDRFRFRWELDGRTLSTLVSLRPDGPWIGRPARRAPRRPASRHSALVARLRREFHEQQPDVVVVAGTSALFPYIAAPAVSARFAVEVNPERTLLSDRVDYFVEAKAGDAMPLIAQAVTSRS